MKILKGFKKGIPLSLAYFPFAFTLGLIAKNYGISPLNILIMTCIVYAGSSEVIIIRLLFENGATIYQTIIAAVIINIRYALINMSILKKQNNESRNIKILSTILLTDESIAYLTIKKIYNVYETFGFGLAGYILFCSFTLIGALFGQIIPLKYASSLNFTLYAIFLSLLISTLMLNYRYIIIVLITLGIKMGLTYFMFPPALITLLSIIMGAGIYTIIKVGFSNE
ncbi:AzlC family ABC transporter permease [Caviibacter abscessus]|uniref:AzlC family ABC transporter permease n=1 Tax=Caviibacter abscessus TaxID=1766719 RepID=UPI000829ED55|nr:AzlC family ABC transporter permease [Caviibacter abscessus]